MVGTTASKVDPVDGIELIRWFDWARRPWGPLMAAERQFDALIGESGDAPRLAAYDHLFDMAHRAIRWLEHNACPDLAFGRRVKAEMMAYRAVADTVRSTILADEGDEMVAQLSDLRDVINHHAKATEDLTPIGTHGLPENVRIEGGSTTGSAVESRANPPFGTGSVILKASPLTSGQSAGSSTSPCSVSE